MPHGKWNLPGPGFELTFPALAGRFSTSRPPGKSKTWFLCRKSFKIFVLMLNKIGNTGVHSFCKKIQNLELWLRLPFWSLPPTHFIISLQRLPRYPLGVQISRHLFLHFLSHANLHWKTYRIILGFPKLFMVDRVLDSLQTISPVISTWQIPKHLPTVWKALPGGWKHILGY